MLLNFNKSAREPLYIQIYSELKNKIMSGELYTDEKMPSKRRLAEENMISENTVMNAYDQLITEGLIYSVERSGYYVADIQNHYTLPQKGGTETQTKAGREELRAVQYDFTQSAPDKNLFPFSVFSKLFRNSLNHRREELLGESGGQGLEPLRSSIQHYLSRSRGVPCRADQIILGPSSDYLLSILVQLMEEKVTVGIEDPGYQGFIPSLQRLNIPSRPVLIDEQGVNIEALKESKANLICVTSNHQFPTGDIMPLKRRQELLKWAGESGDRYILENDYDSEFKYSGIPVSSLKYLDKENKVIHLGSFTRVLSPGIRLSYMVLPEQLLSSYQEKFKDYSSNLNTMIQWTINDFIEEGYFESHLNRSRTFYKKKRDILIKEITRQDKAAEIYGNKAGLHLLVKPSLKFDGKVFKERALDEKIKINLLSDYSVLGQGVYENTLFMSFSSVPAEEIPEVVKRLYEILSLASL